MKLSINLELLTTSMPKNTRFEAELREYLARHTELNPVISVSPSSFGYMQTKETANNIVPHKHEIPVFEEMIRGLQSYGDTFIYSDSQWEVAPEVFNCKVQLNEWRYGNLFYRWLCDVFSLALRSHSITGKQRLFYKRCIDNRRSTAGRAKRELFDNMFSDKQIVDIIYTTYSYIRKEELDAHQCAAISGKIKQLVKEKFGVDENDIKARRKS